MRKRIPKILVTGAAGFIGSAFVRLLAGGLSPKGTVPEVIIIDKLTYAGDLKRLVEVKGKFKFYKTDICSKNGVRSIFAKEKPDIVVHFAAESHVDRSINDAAPFIETNIKGTQILLDTARKIKVNKFIYISCYDEETKAMTTDGLKTYKELKKGDLVFSLNPKSREIEIKPIDKIIVQDYEGEMVFFKSKRINLLVTPNHNMFILKTNKKDLVVEEAEKSSRRSIFYMPNGYWHGKNEEYFYLKGYDRVKTGDLLYILGIFIGDGFTAYQEKQFEAKTGLPREEYLKNCRDAQNGRFKKIDKLGNHICTSHSYRIFFDIPESDKSRKKVESALTNLGIKYYCHKGKAGTHLYFTSRVFMELFSQCGEGAYNKHIPRWALDYSPEYLKYLFDGLMDSDGSKGVIYHTVSKKLAVDICELCVKLGFWPTLGRRHTSSSLGSRKIEGDAYYVCVSRVVKSISRQRNRMIKYKGKVWCLKIKDNKNFLVERNGRFDFCGNTDEVYGEINKGKFDENSPVKPNSPYAASKAAADLLVQSYVRTYKFPAIIIRPSNNYGPWQYPEKLIPLAILRIIGGGKVPVYGKGENIREWLYVDDCAKGILAIMNKGVTGQIYNLGSACESKNIDTVKLLLKTLGASRDRFEFVKDRLGHDIRYSLDSRKISRELGWKPAVQFAQGLKLTVNWSLKHQGWLKSKLKDINKLYK